MPKFNPRMLRRRLVRTALEAAGAVLFIVGTTAATQALTPNVAREVNHFIECFRFMVTDPDAHAELCSPGVPAVHDPVSDIGGGGGAPVTTTTTSTTTTTIDQTTTTTIDPTTTTTGDDVPPTTTTTTVFITDE